MKKINEVFLRDKNPWKLYDGGSILRPEDTSVMDQTATTRSRTTIFDVLKSKDNFSKYDLNGDNFIDCPINGDPFKANIILLFNNPSLPNFTKNRSKKHPKDNFDPQKNYFTENERRIIRDNLTLNSKEMLYTSDDTNIINNGYDWYKNMWNSIGITKEVFSKNFCLLQRFPYPSENFHNDFISRNLDTKIMQLESHKFIVKLARYAISKGKTVIAMRSVHYWEEVLNPAAIENDQEDYGFNYSKNYEDNFFFSLDNLNNSLNKKNITKPLKEKIIYASILQK